jgi:pSer/pThr/pTyr-binding forkhead associated (FHA) protein
MNNSRPHRSEVRGATGSAEIVVRKPGQTERRVDISGDTPIGRAFDNAIRVNEEGVSRYHAVIELRADGFWLSDLSRNGTTVNGQASKSERKLCDGDKISVGGATVLEFRGNEAAGLPANARPAAADQSRPEVGSSHAAPRAPVSIWLIVAAIAVPLTVVGVGALVFSGAFSRSSPSPPSVHIIGVRTGDTISKATLIRTDAESTKEIARVIYQLDDVDLASVRVPPYETELDPSQLAAKLPNLRVSNHVLSLIVEDKDGARRLQPDKIVLAFAGESQTPGASSGTAAANGGGEAGSSTVAVVPASNDVSYMADALAREISKKTQVFAPEFVEAIRARTGDYKFNFADEARRVNPREIASAFSDKGLDPMVGFVLAMSRGKFQVSSGAEGIGLWKLPRPVLAEFAAGQDAGALDDPKRSAAIAAAYTKALFGLFDPEDFMFAIACYGMTTAQAGEIRAKLSQILGSGSQHDFWAAVTAGLIPRDAAERVVRFFAAGIVGEYPQRFGLQSAPLSALYY